MLNFLASEQKNDFCSKLDRFRSILAASLVFFGLLFFAIYKNQKVYNEIVSFPETVKTVSNIINQKLARKHTVVVAPQNPKFPVLSGSALDVDKFSAKSIIAKDQKTGVVLFKKNEYEKRPTASITKLMSALVILEKNPSWASSTRVTAEDLIDTHMYAGDTYTLEDLWNSALVGSSNKAIVTLSEAVGWSKEEFIARMNQKAKELGMSDSVFVDPSGLDPNNVSTASDLAILINEALKSEKIKKTVLMKEYTIYSKERKQKHHMWSTDWLLLGWITNDFADFRGGKTGFITLSGYNFVMQTADAGGHVINVVVLGADTNEARFSEARDVAEWVWGNYKWE